MGGMTDSHSTPSCPTITLNDETEIPQLGFGTWKLEDDVCYRAVRRAIEVGYRHIDTAAVYGNEESVGRGIADAIAAGDVAREDLFVTTKLWNDDQGFDAGLDAFEKSINRLGLEYVDLYLIHWPVASKDLYKASFKAMMRLQGVGRIQSIGVSNFYEEVLDDLIADRGVVPAVNQIELHPSFNQQQMRDFNASKGIATESWSPLGRAQDLELPQITEIAQKIDRTPAQVILRWQMQLGCIAIPCSRNMDRIAENFQIFDFELSSEDMELIGQAHTPEGRILADPRTMGNE